MLFLIQAARVSEVSSHADTRLLHFVAHLPTLMKHVLPNSSKIVLNAKMSHFLHLIHFLYEKMSKGKTMLIAAKTLHHG